MLNNIMIEVYSSSNNMEWNNQGLLSSNDNNVNPSSWIFLKDEKVVLQPSGICNQQEP